MTCTTGQDHSWISLVPQMKFEVRENWRNVTNSYLPPNNKPVCISASCMRPFVSQMYLALYMMEITMMSTLTSNYCPVMSCFTSLSQPVLKTCSPKHHWKKSRRIFWGFLHPGFLLTAVPPTPLCCTAAGSQVVGWWTSLALTACSTCWRCWISGRSPVKTELSPAATEEQTELI